MVNQAKALLSGAKTLKVCSGKGLLNDHISKLPDDIIVYILSVLIMKEAGRTSVLSKRWRYVWAYIPVLNFDTIMDHKLEVKKPHNLDSVNHVVRSHKSLTLDEFTVRFRIDKKSSKHIDNWLTFAIEKRVKRLELDFTNREVGSFLERKSFYTFDNLFFCNNSSLTSLQLISLNVTSEVLDSFFKNCPQLEFVKLRRSNSRLNLRVASLKLKYLEIIECFPVELLEISAPNLVSFKYVGREISVPFSSTTKPAEILIGGDYATHLAKNFSELSRYLSELEKLTLDMTLFEFNIKCIGGFPECKRLKRLEVIVNPGEHGNLFGLISMIEACPSLHNFVLMLEWEKPKQKRKQLKVEGCRPHGHLKMVEIVGFLGNSIDLEFIMYLVESCVALEKIVIDPRDPLLIIDSSSSSVLFLDEEEEERESTARKQAKKLRAKIRKLKPEASLIIL